MVVEKFLESEGSAGKIIPMKIITFRVVRVLTTNACAVFGFSRSRTRLLGWTSAISPSALVTTLGFSNMVMVFFGCLSVGGVAKLDPIEAL
jgi:hypothetical protein